jgi:hypothetical protein
MAIYETEWERIAAAEEWAKEEVKNMPEAVEQWGYANVVSDLVRDFLMSGPSSQELIDIAASQDPGENEE